MDEDLAKETSQPFVAVCIKDEEFQTYTIIGSKANGDKISNELYAKLIDVNLT